MRYENKIRELRKMHHETLEDLAEAIDISRDALRNYEVGKQDVKSEVAKRIAKHYGVSLDYLLFFNLREE
jgi:DNA-binding XRE family transcriptional regulator